MPQVVFRRSRRRKDRRSTGRSSLFMEDYRLLLIGHWVGWHLLRMSSVNSVPNCVPVIRYPQVFRLYDEVHPLLKKLIALQWGCGNLTAV